MSVFEPGGSIEIDDEHEHERVIFVVEGTFELAFRDEAPNRLRSGEGAVFHSVSAYRITNVGRGQGRLFGIRQHTQPSPENPGGGPTPS